MGKKLYYAVAKGRNIGVFTSWADCEASVKGFAGNLYKGFNSHADATKFIAGYTLANKEEKKTEQKAATENTNARQPLQTNTSGDNNIGGRNHARIGSYADLSEEGEEEDFEDERRTDEVFWIDPVPSRPRYTPPPARKRSSPDSLSSGSKRSKYEIGYIDLTDTAPKRSVEPTYSSREASYRTYSGYTPKPRSTTREEAYSQLLTDLFTSTTSRRDALPPPEKFTMDDCSSEQRRVLELVAEGKNVFFTGSAGVGKSFVLEKISKLFKSQGRKQFEDFFITASTGIAAVHVGGMTVHSFAGVGKGEDGIIDLKKKAKKTRRTIKHWKECQTLIIDEVSMLSDDLFDKLDAIGQDIRRCELPFGGMQLILCGDFYQLPPVRDNKNRRCPTCGSFDATQSTESRDMRECHHIIKDTDNNISFPCDTIFARKVGYIFQSKAWKRANFHIIELTKIYRQSDSEFITALNKARVGQTDPSTLRLFSQCLRPLPHDTTSNIIPTKMYPIRALVQEENAREFDALKTPIHIFSAIDTQSNPPEYNPGDLRGVLNDLQAPRGLRLRVGCQVMLLANLDVKGRLVNGSRGVVTGFVSGEEARAEVSFRATMRGSKSGDDSNEMAILRRFMGGDETMQFPRVLFETKNEIMEIIVTPYEWTVQLGFRVEVSRVQIPLMTAWALTIHKCQGMTLDKCVLHLERCFDYGQAYVALSRCKSLEGMQIVGWKGVQEIRADPIVQQFYAAIKNTTA